MKHRPAVFLDRDGTIIRDACYLRDPRGLRFYRGVFPALSALRKAGFRLVVVTNQSGVGRGLMSLGDVRKVHARMNRLLRGGGVKLDGIYVCPHRPDERCPCRKPGTELFLRAARRLVIDLKNSYCIGDRLGDILPARSFGARAILVLTGEGRRQGAPRGFAFETAPNLAAAAAKILKGAPHAKRSG